MNKVILTGRLCAEPEIRYTTGENQTAVARYTLAVDRKFKRDGEQSADFISCVAFGKQGEFAEKYLHKGIKIAVEGRLQTGSYEKDGRKVYTTDIAVENHEFCESKAVSEQNRQSDDFSPAPASQNRNDLSDGFMDVGNVEGLPFA